MPITGLLRLADIGQRRGQLQSLAHLRAGEGSARAWMAVGDAIASGLRGIREERDAIPLREAAARRAAFEERQMQRADQQYTDAEAAKQADARKAARLQQLLQENGGQRLPSDVLLREFGAEDAAHIDQAFDELFPKPKEEEAYTLNPGDRRFKGSTEIASVPPKPEAPKYTAPMRLADGTYQQFEEGKIPAGTKFWQEPRADTFRNPIAVIGPDGKPVYVDPRDALGKQPGSSREQGRPVTSGDANRIADFDTSLDDVTVLSAALQTAGDTGTLAKLGASVPNWVTEVTGWGTDAKKKQALINRVKQVIGKALEGGVLRKEDEIKYEKILPTIGDPNDVVLSKLQGLDQAIKDRRVRLIDALTDAGYETSKFGEYQPLSQMLNRGVSAMPDLSGLPTGRGRKFTSGPFAGQTWAIGADGKPFKVGG